MAGGRATGDASVEIGYVGHATVRLDVAGLLILTDPFLRARLGPLERHGPMPDEVADLDIDLVLISHGHPDHFDPESLALLRGSPTIVVPRGLGARARQVLHGEVIELAAGERLSIGGVTVDAVPASHWISPGAPRAQPIGYVVDAGPRTYFAGDTGPFASLDRVLADVDVALLPVWTWGPHRGPGHLGPKSAAKALAAAGPTVAIPIHWGTLYPRRLDRVWSRPLREPGDRFADHARRLAPATTVEVLRPGETTIIRVGRRSQDGPSGP
jgi:L-ascorbate metabolism protein UlaG (beta-lactamase superfamily)